MPPPPSKGRQPTVSVADQTVSLDVDRAARCGFPEVVYGEGKPAPMIVEIIEAQQARGDASLVTRLDPAVAPILLNRFPSAVHNPVGRTFRLAGAGDTPSCEGFIAVITAGSTDLPVAEEACETLAWMGVRTVRINDVGVAGPHRLPERRDEFRHATALVVVAGMEGALPSVVGGYVGCPVIAVPTSVGYGANLGGIAALLSMLNSCASNVAVVNIDAGFKAGYMAGLIATRVSAPHPSAPSGPA
ncbi:nickel pincer cofactor biosynthesis protein LarB [Botrimarina hoheduenensis]|uniref:AIR carboxylase n=1 Tax=Botrimarina hoheduenensis TaxID=2528000 RepID=A0A5C5VZG2_9BACT|nr:nickel pincer cofactor biosynthesis protein LarB [Botrimarina hoheduenensis]TWT43363.1 AIR carboxylase [Botrimarina hoheduenensis]